MKAMVHSIQLSNSLALLLIFSNVLLGACDQKQKDNAGLNNEASVETRVDAPADSNLATDDGRSHVVKQSGLHPKTVSAWPSARFATAGTIASEPQRVGDAALGRLALLEEAYVNCGIPENAFRELLSGSNVVEAKGRTSAAQGLPYSNNVFDNEQGVSVVSSNCLACHGTPLFGELVIGLGNEFLDFTNNQSVFAERAGALVSGADAVLAWQRYADRISVIAPFVQMHTVGVNPANNLTFALIAHRDADTNAWSQSPLLPLPPTDPAPVSVPPWWRMAKKPAMFSMGEGRSDHARIMMAASMLCSDSIDELEAIDAYAPHIRAYIASLESPQYPFDIDVPNAIEGKELFEKNCSTCHGTYADDFGVLQLSAELLSEDFYPARIVPIDVIQTDDTLVRFAHKEGAAYSDWFNRSYYGKLAVAAPGPGYMAPPLDGIWATAPYLHNGSVPTVAQLLNSGKRPSYWKHIAKDASEPANFDQINLGWVHEVLSQGKPDHADKSIYDTDLPGYSNSGHLFGDHLSHEQRTAVIEYLKTL